MPFDLMPPARELIGVELFQDRRERAAEVWRNVPRQVFDMSHWKCGTKACALGWLAAEKHDGWAFAPMLDNSGRLVPVRGDLRGFTAAAAYFGISQAQSRACFGEGDAMASFHGRWFVSRVTSGDVARSLLALPYRTV